MNVEAGAGRSRRRGDEPALVGLDGRQPRKQQLVQPAPLQRLTKHGHVAARRPAETATAASDPTSLSAATPGASRAHSHPLSVVTRRVDVRVHPALARVRRRRVRACLRSAPAYRPTVPGRPGPDRARPPSVHADRQSARVRRQDGRARRLGLPVRRRPADPDSRSRARVQLRSGGELPPRARGRRAHLLRHLRFAGLLPSRGGEQRCHAPHRHAPTRAGPERAPPRR